MGDLTYRRGPEVTLSQGEAALNEMERLLLDHGVAISSGSHLEEIFLMHTQWLAMHRHEEAPRPNADMRDDMLRTLGLVDFAIKLLRASRSSLFCHLVPHLKLLAEAETDPSQNAPTKPEDQGNRKLFELLVAAAALWFAEDIEVEAPRASTTRTPDITITTEGVRWGVACKVLHSSRVETYRDRVIDGIRQIHDAKQRRDVDLTSAGGTSLVHGRGRRESRGALIRQPCGHATRSATPTRPSAYQRVPRTSRPISGQAWTVAGRGGRTSDGRQAKQPKRKDRDLARRLLKVRRRFFGRAGARQKAPEVRRERRTHGTARNLTEGAGRRGWRAR